jgi:hypothetical protein
MTARNELWFERPMVSAKQGYVVTVAGRTSRIPCPKCGVDYVVYNGNYFCDSWVYRSGGQLAEGECDWALPHPSTTKKDREICDMIGIDYG